MTLEQLRYFLSAAETLSFAAAAEKHFVHQSAIGKSVARLEEEFGLRLFERGNRRLELTEAGKLLQKQARELLAHCDALFAIMKCHASGVIGNLRFSATNLHFVSLLDVYTSFCRDHPGIRWEFPPCSDDLADQVREQVLSGAADIGILSASSDLEPELGRICLGKEAIRLLLPSSHPLGRLTEIPLERLEELEIVDSSRWLRFPLAGLREAFYQKTGRILPVHLTASLLHPGKELLSYLCANMCATPVPEGLASLSRGEYSVLSIEGYEPDFSRWLIWRRDNKNPAVTLFLSAVRQWQAESE